MIRSVIPAGGEPYFYVECRRCLKASDQTCSALSAEQWAERFGFVCVFGAWVCGRCDGVIQGAKP